MCLRCVARCDWELRLARKLAHGWHESNDVLPTVNLSSAMESAIGNSSTSATNLLQTEILDREICSCANRELETIFEHLEIENLMSSDGESTELKG